MMTDSCLQYMLRRAGATSERLFLRRVTRLDVRVGSSLSLVSVWIWKPDDTELIPCNNGIRDLYIYTSVSVFTSISVPIVTVNKSQLGILSTKGICSGGKQRITIP